MDDEDDWTEVRAALDQFGLPADLSRRGAIIEALKAQVRLEADEEGDHDLMRLLCVQLFSLGQAEDALLIWRAKTCNFDTMCGLDVQFMCGAGLDRTREHLREAGTPEALAALDYLEKCEAAGDFAEFSVDETVRQARDYFEVAE